MHAILDIHAVHYLVIVIIVPSTLLCIQLQLAIGSFKFEARLHSYSNPRSVILNGDGCDIFPPCDNIFTFCLRSLGDDQSTSRFNCSLDGPFTTMTFHDDAIDFTSVTTLGTSVSNPVLFTGESWPVRK